ncbi:MAG: hypothetical protein ACUVWX_03405, partial [Kiritimatiellia bacterium]
RTSLRLRSAVGTAAKKRTRVDYRAKQQPPVKLGTSGGAELDIANGYCCGGTLGALVQDGANQYILSNYHVLAGDQAYGGNGRVSTIGDAVIQPGLIDVGCDAGKAQVVGWLYAYTDPFQGANVDAAIAVVAPGMVDPSGSILGIGTISSGVVTAVPGQKVKKSGRTTGLTVSTVMAVNATVNVYYDTECAGALRGVKTYTGQILVANNGNKFLAAGDSGSLMVENLNVAPRAVGLLYAGSSKVAVAHPIEEVLDALQVVLVGSTAASAGSVEDALVTTAKRAQMRYGAALLALVRGGAGHAVGLTSAGRVGLLVLVESNAAAAEQFLPEEFDGVPIEVVEVGRIQAF